IMVGGELASIGGSMRIGSHDLFVAESCEYKNSYHKFSPTVAVILNVDIDHLDFFSGLDDIIESFTHFANQVPKDSGVVVANIDDANTRTVLEKVDRNVITFGLSHDADVYADYIKDSNGFFGFSIYHKGNHYCDVKLSVPGKFNVLNALASAAVAIHLGVDGESFKKGIQSYTGVGRRLEYKTTCNGARVFDDYAHHPNEIISALRAADAMGKRTICIFQPHTYTRTEALFDEFVEALSLADIVVLAEIFAAREININNTSSAQLAEKIPNAHFFKTFIEIADFIKDTAREGDIVLTMGAGDVYKVADLL
ncbi:MAG: UDP-N-acetylmuramate--L-alanine ligase, partial [Clostridia bacterium]|nr:UDP-N-acetylmuramate--L-alanine ligase [Clostridia bacterium]